MEYTSQLFVKFLKDLNIFDNNNRSAMHATSCLIEEREENEKVEWEQVRALAEKQVKNYSSNTQFLVSDFQNRISKVLDNDVREKDGLFRRLQECKEALALISSSERSIENKELYVANRESSKQQVQMNVDDILQGKVDFTGMLYNLNITLKGSRKKEIANECASFFNTCRTAELMLSEEINALRGHLIKNSEVLHTRYREITQDVQKTNYAEWTSQMEFLDNLVSKYVEQNQTSSAETDKEKKYRLDGMKQRLRELANAFFEEYPPQKFAEEYNRLYSMEPSFANYKCYKEMPKNIHISTLEYDISPLGLSDYTKDFLDRYYFFLHRDNKLCIPYCVSFGPEFNYLFKFEAEKREDAVKNACDLGMRLFMMLPPGKVNFTFADPVALGASFAMFTRLVDVNDRTSEVINGKIWSTPADIEQKLKIMTDHISNVTQRCLQGKYENIYEYNIEAEQNAEAYQVLMIMDFPAGMTDQSLKLLKQIITSGPKCGVFTIIYWNESQYQKFSERSYPLIANIETDVQEFNFDKEGKQIFYAGEKVKGKPLLWESLRLPSTDQMNQIIDILKKSIKNADKVVIGIDKVIDEVSQEEITHTTKDGINIPIGVRGAKEIQYLTLGVGGSHHALIAGVAGSGKSSLLHTIILGALQQYSPDELSLYLVDFKRGVEFKIYADFELPSFKVIAIESEREFGYNILCALEREQKIRADLFKKNHVDRIEEYRSLKEYPKLKKMPRILVIMDEFHELFSSANDEFAKKSAVILERIVRQGRAFGIHLILASQSYSNITGVNRAVFDQMAVRIVLKCSKTDANLLLDNGSTEIDQISIDDPGRAVYNSEAGNKEYNSHFRVAYIAPEKHRGMLQKISKDTAAYADPEQPTRILLSNIEDNKYSIFNQFTEYKANKCPVLGRLYIGESLSVTQNMMSMELGRNENANLLMLGNNTEKARNMFAFAILSICINYWVKNKKAPDKPFIYLLNSKPLEDGYFKDIPKIIAKELLPEYVRYIHCGEEKAVQEVLSGLYDDLNNKANVADETEKFFFVFGYQRAEELKSEIKLSQSDDIDSLFNIMSNRSDQPRLSPKEMFHNLVKNGAQQGIHVILWQDSFSLLERDDNNIMSYFNLKIAFDMTNEEYSRSVYANDTALMNENSAIYYNKARDNQKFRPYQEPDETWLEDISEKLKDNKMGNREIL